MLLPSRPYRRSWAVRSGRIALAAMALSVAMLCSVAMAGRSSRVGSEVAAPARVAHGSGHTSSGLVLSGPHVGLVLGSTYGYNLALTNTWRYVHVRLMVSVPAAHYQLVRPVALWPGGFSMLTFSVRYVSAALVSQGMNITIVLPGRHGKGGRRLLSRHYGLSLAPGSSGGHPPSRPPGVYLAENNPSCPLINVMLKVPYSCIVDIVNGPTVYNNVFLVYVVTSSGQASSPISIPELPANSEVVETIPVTYGLDPIGDSELGTKALQLAVGYGSPLRGVTLYRNNYGVSLAPGQQIVPIPPLVVSGITPSQPAQSPQAPNVPELPSTGGPDCAQGEHVDPANPKACVVNLANTPSPRVSTRYRLSKVRAMARTAITGSGRT